MNMGYIYNREIYMIELALDEIECELPEIDSNSLGEYIDWEYEVD